MQPAKQNREAAQDERARKEEEERKKFVKILDGDFIIVVSALKKGWDRKNGRSFDAIPAKDIQIRESGKQESADRDYRLLRIKHYLERYSHNLIEWNPSAIIKDNIGIEVVSFKFLPPTDAEILQATAIKRLVVPLSSNLKKCRFRGNAERIPSGKPGTGTSSLGLIYVRSIIVPVDYSHPSRTVRTCFMN